MRLRLDEERLANAKPTKTALLVCEGRCSRDVLTPTRHALYTFERVNLDDSRMHYGCGRCGHKRVWGTWMHAVPQLEAAA